MAKGFTTISISEEDYVQLQTEFFRFRKQLRRLGIRSISALALSGAYQLIEQMKKKEEEQLPARLKRAQVARTKLGIAEPVVSP